MRRTLDMFEQIYGVKVETTAIGFDKTIERLTELYDSGELPDVMQLSGYWPRLLASRGYLAELDQFREDIPELFANPFPWSIEAGTYQAVLYAIPFTVTPLGLWCARNPLRDAGRAAAPPPRTIAELEQDLEAVKDGMNGLPNAYPLRIDVSNEYATTRFWPWIWNHRGNPMPDDGSGNVALESINWTDEGTTRAFEWLQKVANAEYLMKTATGWWDRQLMAHDKIGFMLDGPYLTSLIPYQNFDYGTRNLARTRRLINDAFGVAAPPVLHAEDKPVTVAEFHQLAIAKDATNPELARKLVRFLTTNDLAIETFLIPQGGLLPVRADNALAKYGKGYDDAIGRVFMDDLALRARLPPFGPRYGDVAGKIATAMRNVALNGASVEDQLTVLDTEVKAIYAKTDAG